jgi:hypothetical protein
MASKRRSMAERFLLGIASCYVTTVFLLMASEKGRVS